MRRAAPLIGLLLLAGCGGHGGNSSAPSSSSTVSVGKGKGTAILRVRWPARAGRLVPNAANEITVSLLQGTTVVASAEVPRPAAGQTASAATFTGLAYGSYSVRARAFPNADGSGVAQASEDGSLTVAEDAPGNLALALGSTVTSLAISAPATLTVGQTGTAMANAKDASGNVVLLAAGGGAEDLRWSSDNVAVATVSGTGPTATLAGVTLGISHVTASLAVDDAGTKVTGSAAVAVAGRLVLAPSDAKSFSQTRASVKILSTPLQDYGVSPGSGGTFYTWRALFPLSGIPAGSTIRSATFSAKIVSSQFTVDHGASAFAAGSSALTATTLGSAVSVGTLPGAGGAQQVDATAAVQGLLASGAAFAGFSVGSNSATPVTWSSPSLTVVYSTP